MLIGHFKTSRKA